MFDIRFLQFLLATAKQIIGTGNYDESRTYDQLVSFFVSFFLCYHKYHVSTFELGDSDNARQSSDRRNLRAGQ